MNTERIIEERIDMKYRKRDKDVRCEDISGHHSWKAAVVHNTYYRTVRQNCRDSQASYHTFETYQCTFRFCIWTLPLCIPYELKRFKITNIYTKLYKINVQTMAYNYYTTKKTLKFLWYYTKIYTVYETHFRAM